MAGMEQALAYGSQLLTPRGGTRIVRKSRVHGAMSLVKEIAPSQVHSSFVVWPLLPWRHIQWDSLNLHNSSKNISVPGGTAFPAQAQLRSKHDM